MTTIAAPKKTYEVVALLLLLPALYIQVQWLHAFSGGGILSDEARGERFLEAFPGFLSSSKVLALLSLICAVLAVVFASKSFNQRKVVWRVTSFITVLIGSLIALLSVFQLI